LIKILKKCFPLLFIVTLLFPIQYKAQDFINENSLFECDQAFEIGIPLKVKNNPTVFYQYEEQFSFWYKFSSQSDEVVSVELSALDTNSKYSVFVYENEGGSLCTQIFNGKNKPLKNQLIDKQVSSSERFTQFKFNASAQKYYYFCVLNTSVYNCGHQLKLTSAIDSIAIKAIHIPCVVEEKYPQKEKEALDLHLKPFIALIQLKDQTVQDKYIQAEIRIKDIEFNSEISIDYDSTHVNSLAIEKGKEYKVSCTAPGYQRFEHHVVISDYMVSDSSDFILYLKPLKSGDIFLMNHIYFHPNTYALKSGASKELEYLATFLKNNKELKIELSGHTNGNNKIKRNKSYKNRGAQWDFTGTSKKLSTYRALEIKQKLLLKGIDEKRILTKGIGGDKMIIQEAKTLESIQKNVRVEVKIL
jgi:outer membrane protein OmpA-like peptidoglycan-associated protein